MLRFVSALAFALLLTVPAHATATQMEELESTCSAQPTGAVEVDGATATEAQMKAAHDDVQNFVNAADQYVACVSIFLRDAKKLPLPDQRKLQSMMFQAADEKEELGCSFQKQLDVFNRKHGFTPVDFDQVCLDRFARHPETAPAAKTP